MRVVGPAIAALAGLAVMAPASLPPYNRADWGGWSDPDGDCRSTRTEVLMRDAREDLSPDKPAYLWRDGGCELAWGQWRDPYSGLAVNDPGQMEVDHVLSLKEAHEGGGWRWPAAEKGAFFNWSPNLLAVAAGANRAKGSKGPARWRPPERFQCEYVRIWTGARAAWRLKPPGEADASAVKRVLEACRPLPRPADERTPGPVGDPVAPVYP